MSPPVAHPKLSAELISGHQPLWDFYQYISEHRGEQPRPEAIQVLEESASSIPEQGGRQLVLYYADESCSLGEKCRFFSMRLSSLANATEMNHGWGRLAMTRQGPWVVPENNKTPLRPLDPREQTGVPQVCTTMHALGGPALADLKCEDPASTQEQALEKLTNGLLGYFLWDLSLGPIRTLMGGSSRSFPMTRFLWKSASQAFAWVPKTLGPAYLAALAYDQGAEAVGVKKDSPWREEGSLVVAAAAWGGLTYYQARVGLALSDMGWKGALASRAGNGLLLVGLVDAGAGLLVADNYESGLQSRVADYAYASDDRENKQLFDQELWGRACFWRFTLALRKGFRLIAPSMMEGAVSYSNPEIVAQLRQEDRETCIKVKQALQGAFLELARVHGEDSSWDLSFLSARADTGAWVWAPLLRQAMATDSDGQALAAVQQTSGLSPKAFEAKLKQFLLQDFQEALAALYAIELPVNDWVRQYFHADGALKSGYEVEFLQNVLGPQEQWPKQIREALHGLQLQRQSEIKAMTHPELAHAHGL